MERICKICGKKFDGYRSAAYCDNCHPRKNRKKRFLITPGTKYGCITVIKRTNREYAVWVCKCGRCGKKFEANASLAKKYAETGCADCREKKRDQKKIQEVEMLIGRVDGSLEIVGCAGVREIRGRRSAVAECKCLKCNEIFEIPATKIGQIKECAKCAEKNLDKGREIGKKLHVDGTLISAIDGRRKNNKNSTTGHKGVSHCNKTGKYRAYIYFKRKQYYLGIYEKLEDAVAARKMAEKKIFGDFLKWYENEYMKNGEISHANNDK